MTTRYTEADPAWRNLSLEDKYKIAIGLRRQGWPYRRIAVAVNVANDTARRWVSGVGDVVRLTKADRARLAEPSAPVFPLVEVRLLTLTENTRLSVANTYDIATMPPDLVALLADLAGKDVPSLVEHDRALEAVERAAGIVPAATATKLHRWVAVARRMLPEASLPDVELVEAPAVPVEPQQPTAKRARRRAAK